MNKLKYFIFLVYSILLCQQSFAYENLVYTWRGYPNHIAEGKIAIKDLQKHYAQIDILSSQAYHIDENGNLSGTTNPKMDQIAADHHIQLMPIFSNNDFDPQRTHVFLSNPAAQTRAIQAIVKICQQHHYAGAQIDFEGMPAIEQDAFSHFYQQAANALHQNHFQVSAAIVPMLTDDVTASAYLQSRYQHWSGAYDYKALADSSDFITLMMYDQHGSITPPGPMASMPWSEAILRYALAYIPVEKISLGIPLHSGYWYTGKQNGSSIHMIATDLTFPEAMTLLRNNHATLHWDKNAQVPYTFFIRHELYQYVFAENAASFQAKIALVKKYHLRGVSLWCLGEEDPKIWHILAQRKKFK